MRKLHLFLFGLLFTVQLAAQQNVGIGTKTPASSAALEIKSTNQGLLIPRMDSTSRNGIPNPAIGLMVFDSTSHTFWYFNGAWREIGQASPQTLLLNGDTLSIVDGNSIVLPAAANLFVNTVGLVRPDSNLVNLSSDDFVFGSPQLDYDGNSDHSARMFFDKSKSAFRAGSAYSAVWDSDSIGFHSVAMGEVTTASGFVATALGNASTAKGAVSTAMGLGTNASGIAATSMGRTTTASGESSTAMGDNTVASGNKSIAMGDNTTASAGRTTAMGWNTTASGNNSTAMGNSSMASGLNSTAMGHTTAASGVNSTSVGWNTVARSAGEFVVGMFNTDYTPNSTSAWDAEDRLFTVGNGTSQSDSSDAMVILKNGNTGFGTSTPDTTFHLVGKMKYDDGTQADGYVLTSDSLGNATWADPSSVVSAQAWGLNGNSGTTYGTNYIGTADAQNLMFKVNGEVAGRIERSDTRNASFGYQALYNNTTGKSNTANGYVTLYNNTTGGSNTANGTYALYYNTTGNSNTANGEAALLNNTTGAANTANGIYALYENTTGQYNTGNGYKALFYNTTGDLNTANGTYSLYKNTTGDYNIANGTYALYTNITGDYNTGNGPYALYENTTGNNNTALGYYADVASGGLNNATAIGARALVGADNSLVLGSINGVNGATANTKVGIGTSTPDTTFHLVGKMKYDDGSQADGYVLTSDVDGNATWAATIGGIFTNINNVVQADCTQVDFANDDFVFGSPQLNGDGNSDHYGRMFFDKSKSAFRAGRVSDSNWDADSIGNFSIAMGNNPKAIGNNSVALGYNTTTGGIVSTAMGSYTTASGDAATAMGSATLASGNTSTAMGENTLASGNASTAMGENTTASGHTSTAMGSATVASGNTSTAMGENTTASGISSTAMGVSATASGEGSVAIGTNTFATGKNSTALGQNGVASGTASTVMGKSTIAPSAYEISIGSYNTDYTPNSTTSWNAADRIFTVGNGKSIIGLSDAMVILKSGNTGFGTSTPDTTFHLVGKMKYDDGTQANGYVLTSDADGNATWEAASSATVASVFDTLGGVVVPGSAVDISSDDFVFGSPQLDDDGNSDHDNRFFFDKSKGAFRAGRTTATNWDTDSLGNYSVALGGNAKAVGDNAVALGRNIAALGESSVALGAASIASGKNSFVAGSFSQASGQGSLAIGSTVNASGLVSLAMGSLSEASGANSTAIGNSNDASGDYALAMGFHTLARSYSETVIGSFSTDYTPNSTTGWDVADRLFTIGNGTISGYSNALVILKSGNLGLGTSTPDTTFHLVGKMKYEDGTQADGYVLTSDSAGNASWEPVPNIIRDTVNIDLPILGGGSGIQHIETVTVAGAKPGATVYASPSGQLVGIFSIGYAWVSATDTVKIVFLNHNSTGNNNAAMDFYITVIN